MLRHTFIHAPGVGIRTERWLWRNGLAGWDDLLGRPAVPGIGAALLARISGTLIASRQALAAGEAGYFQQVLPSRETWRSYGDFRGSARYLDIETSGLGIRDAITVIGVSDGRRAHAFVAGRNLDRFGEALEGASLLVTFNGKAFDLPFIRHQFPSVKLPAAHIDLRHVFRSLGLTGGLKKIERRIGLDRGDLSEVDGAFAVALWRRHLAGDARALPTLIRYNLEDVVSLRYLMEWAYNRRLASCGGPARPLTIVEPTALDLPYSRDIIQEVAAEIGSWRGGG